MPDATDIPEAKDPFDKRVALTIAILAICLSFIANLGDNSKTSSILKTSEASDQWNYFQAKSTKAQLAAMHGDLIMRLSSDDRSDDARNRAIQLGKDAQRYDIEKGEIKKQAESLAAQAAHFSAIMIDAIRRHFFSRSPWSFVRSRSWASRIGSGGWACSWESPASVSAPPLISSEWPGARHQSPIFDRLTAS